MIPRRDAIQRLSLLLGGVLSTQLTAGLLGQVLNTGTSVEVTPECMTSTGCVNPSLTYMALTARAADFAVEELKKGNL